MHSRNFASRKRLTLPAINRELSEKSDDQRGHTSSDQTKRLERAQTTKLLREPQKVVPHGCLTRLLPSDQIVERVNVWHRGEDDPTNDAPKNNSVTHRLPPID